MANRPPQYIGVTGFMSEPEVSAVLELFPEETGPKVMIGVLAGSRTMNSTERAPSKRYPARNDLGSIFQPHTRALNLIHLGVRKDEDHLAQKMTEVELYGGPNIDGFQLNMIWPDPVDIMNWKTNRLNRRPTTVVLQCGAHALGEINNDPLQLRICLEQYRGVIDYCLIDPSGGKGQPFDPELAIAYLSELYSPDWPMNFGIAGGLCAESIESLLGPVLAQFPNVCIDAEGCLRDEDDDLHPEKTCSYVLRAKRMMAESKQQ